MKFRKLEKLSCKLQCSLLQKRKESKMSRPVEMRASYDNDSGFLVRLSKAIERDVSQPDTWRREVQIQINSLVSLLLEANKRKISSR